MINLHDIPKEVVIPRNSSLWGIPIINTNVFANNNIVINMQRMANIEFNARFDDTAHGWYNTPTTIRLGNLTIT